MAQCSSVSASTSPQSMASTPSCRASTTSQTETLICLVCSVARSAGEGRLGAATTGPAALRKERLRSARGGGSRSAAERLWREVKDEMEATAASHGVEVGWAEVAALASAGAVAIGRVDGRGAAAGSGGGAPGSGAAVGSRGEGAGVIDGGGDGSAADGCVEVDGSPADEGRRLGGGGSEAGVGGAFSLSVVAAGATLSNAVTRADGFAWERFVWCLSRGGLQSRSGKHNEVGDELVSGTLVEDGPS